MCVNEFAGIIRACGLLGSPNSLRRATMAANMLTPCIQNIFRDALPSKPTVQIIEIKQIATAANGEAPTRIKCVPHSHPTK